MHCGAVSADRARVATWATQRHGRPQPASSFVSVLVAPSLIAVQAVLGQTNWTQVSPAATPQISYGAAMAFDAVRQRTVLFGGSSSTALLADTWTYDGTTWTQHRPVQSPSPRAYASMGFDVARGVTVLFGGLESSRFVDDTWTWDGANWTQVATARRPPLWQPTAMAFEPTASVLLLVGSGTTWAWDGTTWSLAGRAPVRDVDHFMCTDSVSGRALLYNGAASGGLFEWRSNAWVPLADGGYGSGPIAHDPSRNRLVMVGVRSPAVAPFTRELVGSDWQEITTVAHPTQLPGAMVYDRIRGCIVLLGFGWPNNNRSETWEYRAASSAHAETFGSTTPSPHGGLWLRAVAGPPRLGTTFACALPMSTSLQIGLLGTSNTLSPVGPLPFDLSAFGFPGCFLRVSAEFVVAGVPTGAETRYDLPIPNVPRLAGTRFYLQAAFASPLQPSQLVTSNGIAGFIR